MFTDFGGSCNSVDTNAVLCVNVCYVLMMADVCIVVGDCCSTLCGKAL